jgi:hypothetical protein
MHCRLAVHQVSPSHFNNSLYARIGCHWYQASPTQAAVTGNVITVTLYKGMMPSLEQLIEGSTD